MQILADLSEILSLPADFQRARKRAVGFALSAIEAEAVREAPHRTGNLANAITHNRTPSGGEVFVSGNAAYAVYVHQGTGLFGPRRERIRPTKKKALFWAGAAHPAPSVRGQRPNPFMDRAADRARPEVDRIFEEADL